MCCFNLTEYSELVDGDMKHFKELMYGIDYDKFPFDLPGLFSWLSVLHWLKALLLGAATVVTLGILLCCLCQFISPCLNNLRNCLPTSSKRDTRQLLLMMYEIDKNMNFTSIKQDCAEYCFTSVSTKWRIVGSPPPRKLGKRSNSVLY